MFNSRQKELFNYILPSAGALCVTYLYNIVDGIFVGQGVGPMALAAVNITVPFVTALVALSSLFAMGGSTVIAIRLGRNDVKGANDAFMCAFILTLLLSLIFMLIGMVFPIQISALCGGSTIILPMAAEYLFYYTAFSIPFLLSNCFAVFVRNDGAPRVAFFGMCAGAKVFNRGIPEFLTQLNTPITAFCYNWVLLHTLGDIGVATFSILSFIYSFAYAILSGVAQGLQPLWGNAFGAKDINLLKQYFNSGIKINLVSSFLIFILLCVFDTQTVSIFTKDTELLRMTSAALPVFAMSFLFMAINLIYTAFFYSTKQTIKSDIIAINRGVILKGLFIFGIPYFFGVEYMWHSVLAAEVITLLICLFCKKIGTKQA